MINNTLTDNQVLYAIADEFCGNIRYYDEPVDDSDNSIRWCEKLQLSLCYSSKSAADEAFSRLRDNAHQNIKNTIDDDPRLRSVTSSHAMLATFSRSMKIIRVESSQLSN